MGRSELQRLAKKYLDGTATSEEKEVLDQWYDTIHEDQPEMVVSGASEADVKNRILEKIRGEMGNDAAEEVEIPSRQGPRIFFRIASAAAVLLFTIGLGWYFVRQLNYSSLGSQRMININASRITRINLPDGSVVWLSARTIFNYPVNFTGKVRDVQLVEGRAFFDVKHDAGHPFFVRTRNLDITVLGTSFDVRTYEKQDTKVSVISGKVGITRPGHNDEPAVMLLPKQEIVLSRKTRQLTKEATPEAVVNLWCKSPLVFEQQGLDSVFKAIEKQYNTRIDVENKQLLDEKISITLGNQRLDSIMEILSFTKHFNYQIANDSTVIIK